ncbi:MAG: LacI family DNA-binding transcriptional regulator [Chloroflexi bacterium]|nr:LacI family DNA-binding transcriptional regulator [Chloroflexota bacterium]
MRVTVRDVARLAGVSIATASYAVNDRGQVSSLTRRRVQEAARLLNYHPSHAARGLRGRRAQTVGLILPSGRTRVEHAPFLEVLGGVNQAIATAGFDVLLAHSASEADEVAVCKRLILSGKVDALILVRSRVADPRFVELRAQRIPFVVYGRGDTPATHAVEVDNIAGARLAVEHLLRLGHRRIAYLGGPPDLTLSVDRWQGFLQGLGAAGVEVDRRLIGQGELTVDSGEAVFGQLLDGGGPRPTAAFAATDAIALGALRAARARRLEPGRDVALVGFDDVPSAAFAEPPLTTIRQHPHAVGMALGRLVLDQLAGHPIVQPYRRLEPELVVRASCGSAARNGGKLA